VSRFGQATCHDLAVSQIGWATEVPYENAHGLPSLGIKWFNKE
jgi:hypothetical protein